MLFQIVGLYTILHFLVNFACAVLLYHQTYPFLQTPADIIYAFLLYNFFAFAVQLPIGIIADSINKNALFAITGCFCVILAYLCIPLGITACIIAGIGSASFHIGAGIDVLNLSNRKWHFCVLRCTRHFFRHTTAHLCHHYAHTFDDITQYRRIPYLSPLSKISHKVTQYYHT